MREEINYSKIDGNNFTRYIEQPYGIFLQTITNVSHDALLESAYIYFSSALGKHPEYLNTDAEYRNYVRHYVDQILINYVVTTAVFVRRQNLLDRSGTSLGEYLVHQLS